MCVACPVTATSRNLSSLESRQAVIRTSTLTHWACALVPRRKFIFFIYISSPLYDKKRVAESRQSGIGLAAEELAGAGAADEFAGLDDGAAAGKDGFGRAFDADALEHGIVDAHVVCFGADDFFVVGIEDHQVGVRPDGNGSFAGVEAKEFRWRGGNELDKTIGRKMLAVDAAGVDET